MIDFPFACIEPGGCTDGCSSFELLQYLLTVRTPRVLAKIGRVDGELVNDQVPLADIKCIVSTSEMHEGTSEGGQNERSGPYISDGNYVIEILTKPDGLNTGRNYLLKTDDVRVAQVLHPDMTVIECESQWFHDEESS